MRDKRDMYIDRKNSNNRKHKKTGKHGRDGRRNGLAAVIVIIAALIFGFGTFYITREKLRVQDGTRKSQINLRSRTEPKGETDKDAPNNSGIEGDTGDSAAEDTKGDTADRTEGNTAGTTDNTQESSTQKDTATKDSGQEANTGEGSIGEKNTGDAARESDVTEGNTEEDLKETFMPGFVDQRMPIKVKGIYVTGPRAGRESYMKELIELVDSTELNAMVIDIKNDSGEITYKMDLPEVKEIHADVNYISDIKQLIKELKQKDIYLIARIVAFKDPILAKGRPDLCIKKKDGDIFYDKDGLSWVNPYKKEVWEYLISVAREAAYLGFDEIQFDYIRFSTDSGMKNVDFGKEAKGTSKMDVITEFTKYACENLKPLGVFVSADVYGTIIDSKIDAEIVGQNYKEMAKYLDYICPMIYPSHYQDGAYGIKHPDLKPYNLILSALNKSRTALEEEDIDEKKPAVVRSWLQDFTATWLKNHKTYGPEEIRDQIQAVYDAGYEEWILWNGNNNYTKDGLMKE